MSENENAAMRALMLIGADQAGIDPTLVADDLRLTMAARLPAAIYDKLLGMLARVDHDVVVNGTRAEAGPAPQHAPAFAHAAIEAKEQLEPAWSPQPPDPFSSIGFDFDESAE